MRRIFSEWLQGPPKKRELQRKINFRSINGIPQGEYGVCAPFNKDVSGKKQRVAIKLTADHRYQRRERPRNPRVVIAARSVSTA